jgi:hypothetical protein
MKRLSFFVLGVCILSFIGNSPAIAGELQNYAIGKAGVASPKGGNLGFNGEIAVGHYIHPNIAGEMGVGYFNSGNDSTHDVVPVTASIKAIIPLDKQLDIYGLAGVGGYFTHEAIFGPHLGGGLTFNTNEQIFFGVEGKYIWANNDINLSGPVFTVNIGYRF